MENTKKNNEIDIIGIIKRILKEGRLLGAFVLVFAVLGVIVALNKQKIYTTTVILAPEISGGSSLPESLSSIASMVGVNLGNAGGGVDAIYPQIYPDVLTSSDFIINLFDIPIKQQEDSVSKSYYKHLINDTKIPFWSYPSIWILKLIKKDSDEQNGNAKINNFKLTKKQNEILNLIRSNISCVVDKNTNVISISVNDFDPVVSATMADTIQKQLQQYITIYRTKKARNDVAYAQKLYNEARQQYVKARQAYGTYADANEDLLLESYKTKRDDLENEMQLRYNIYNQIAQQLQLAKAKVQEQTPVFSIIQGATVPLKPSSMPRSFLVIIYMFVGVLADAAWILYLRDIVKSKITKRKAQ